LEAWRGVRFHRPMRAGWSAPGTLEDYMDGFSPDVRSSWEDSFLADLPASAALALLERAEECEFDSGTTFYRGVLHAETATLALVASGLLRIYISSADGREVTIRYASEGAVVGLPAVILAGGTADAGHSGGDWLMAGGAALAGEAVRPSRILRWSPDTFRRLASENAEVAWPLCRYLAQEMTTIQRTLVAGVFLPVKGRIARHLLDLAVMDDGQLVAPVSHQDVAHAIGSVREVVSRALREMQRCGLVARRDGALLLVDRAGLHALSGEL
jgi:CRP/FNR family transcriptional regulator